MAAPPRPEGVACRCGGCLSHRDAGRRKRDAAAIRAVPCLLAVLSVLDLTQPGLLGLALAELVANTIGKQPSALAPVTQALIPYLTVGWLATELLLRREYRTGSNRLS